MSSPTDPVPVAEHLAVPGPADAAMVLHRVLDGAATPTDEPVLLEAGYGHGAFAIDADEPVAVLVRLGPEAPERVAREAALLGWLERAGFPAVPLVGATTGTGAETDGPVGLVVRRVDRSFVERIAESPTEAPDVLADMGRLQARLHLLPVDGAPAAATSDVSAGGSLVEAVRARAAAAGRDDLEAAVAHVASLLAASSAPLVIGHGDLAPGNVRLDEAGTALLASWDRAAVAPAGWDVARGALTIWASAYLAPNRAHRAAMKMLRDYLLERYLTGYREAVEAAGGTPVTDEDLAGWDVVHACDWSLDLDAGPRPGDPWDPLLLVNDRKGLARDLARRIRRTTEGMS
jgi:aminoglycoside phosphotransferase (APT) family kinase protein